MDPFAQVPSAIVGRDGHNNALAGLRASRAVRPIWAVRLSGAGERQLVYSGIRASRIATWERETSLRMTEPMVEAGGQAYRAAGEALRGAELAPGRPVISFFAYLIMSILLASMVRLPRQ